MIHVKDLRRLGSAEVHALGMDGNTCLCTRAYKYKVIEGITVQALYEVPYPITCKGCGKALEMLLRNVSASLAVESLEILVDKMMSLRNGSSGEK